MQTQTGAMAIQDNLDTILTYHYQPTTKLGLPNVSLVNKPTIFIDVLAFRFFCSDVLIGECELYTSWPLFTKRKDVLLQDLVKSRSSEI